MQSQGYKREDHCFVGEPLAASHAPSCLHFGFAVLMEFSITFNNSVPNGIWVVYNRAPGRSFARARQPDRASCQLRGDAGSPCPGAVAAGRFWAGLFRPGRHALPPVWPWPRRRPAGVRRGRQRRAEAAESSSPAGPAAAPGQPSAVAVPTGQQQRQEARQELRPAAARRAPARSRSPSPPGRSRSRWPGRLRRCRKRRARSPRDALEPRRKRSRRRRRFRRRT